MQDEQSVKQTAEIPLLLYSLIALLHHCYQNGAVNCCAQDAPHAMVSHRAAEGKAAVFYLVGKAPEQQGHHHRAPQLCHDVEEAETPVAEDCDGGGCLAAQLGQQAFTEGCTQQAVSRCSSTGQSQLHTLRLPAEVVHTCRVDDVSERVHYKCKRSKESNEGQDAGVEQALCRQDIRQLHSRHCFEQSSKEGRAKVAKGKAVIPTLAYRTVKPIAMGRLTHVFRKGMTSAPLPGAVTTSTSCTEQPVQYEAQVDIS